MIPLLFAFGIMLVGLILAVHREVKRVTRYRQRVDERMRLYVGTGAHELPAVAPKPLAAYKLEVESPAYDRMNVSDVLPDWINAKPTLNELEAWQRQRDRARKAADKA
jgi:hypothetical protein